MSLPEPTPTSQPLTLHPAVPADAAPTRRTPLPRKVYAGAAIVALFALAALLAPLLTTDGPNVQRVADRLQGPSGEYLLGTDGLGRDLLTRILYAIRIDLPVAILAVLLPALVGTVLGAVAGFYRSWVDVLVTRSADVVQAFPVYVFIIALVFALGAGVRSILIAFVVIGWVVYARLIRAEVLRIRDLEYVQAAEAAGLSRARVLVRHVMPNAIKQTVVYMSSDVVLAVLTFAALSYFGLGVSPPTAEWGTMIAEGQAYLSTNPLLSIAPGGAILLLGVGFMLIGDGLDDHLR